MIEDKVWTERHRPSSLDDVIGQDEAVNRMKKWVNDDSVPNLLLQGPAGAGKTASVVAFAKEKYGDDWRSNLFQFNSSDDRGIDSVRNEIKSFAQQSPSGDHQFKIIFLDEIDHTTKAAQAALRRIMEQYSDVTRFFLSCNYSSKIIDPIQSRCTVLPFNRLDDSDIDQIIINILESEGIEYQEPAVNQIIEYVDGDARRAVQTLQTSVEDGELTQELLDVINRQVDGELISEAVDNAVRGEMEETWDIVVNDMVPYIIDPSRFAKKLQREIQSNDDIPDDTGFYAISRVGEMERAIREGNSMETQIMAMMAELPVIRHSSINQYE